MNKVLEWGIRYKRSEMELVNGCNAYAEPNQSGMDRLGNHPLHDGLRALPIQSVRPRNTEMR
jgi:hypothetical protein